MWHNFLHKLVHVIAALDAHQGSCMVLLTIALVACGILSCFIAAKNIKLMRTSQLRQIRRYISYFRAIKNQSDSLIVSLLHWCLRKRMRVILGAGITLRQNVLQWCIVASSDMNRSGARNMNPSILWIIRSMNILSIARNERLRI